MLRAVIWDFDLTLADSSAGAIDCINHALQLLGLPKAPDRRILDTAAHVPTLLGVTLA